MSTAQPFGPAVVKAPRWMLTEEAMPDLSQVERLAPMWRLGQDHQWSWFVANGRTLPIELRPWVAIEAWTGGNPFTVRRERSASLAEELCEVWRSVGFVPPSPLPKRKRVDIWHGAAMSVTEDEIRCSLSWSLSPAVAEQFAGRLGDGCIWTAKVAAGTILCAHNVRQELEVIVDPVGLQELTWFDLDDWRSRFEP